MTHKQQKLNDKAKKPVSNSKDKEIDSDLTLMQQKSEAEFPGKYPYTRGIYSEMYSKKLWTMRQYSGFSSPEESNKRYRYLLEQGQTGLSIAFDLPTQMGYDSDHELAVGEVGRAGVSISSLQDMETLFQGINVEDVSASMTINSTAPILLAFYIEMARKKGVSPKSLKGTIQNDILKEYIARGTYIYPPKASMRLVTDVFEYCTSNVPYWNTISVSGYHIREAGANAVQELAFTFANAIAYVEAAMSAGLDIDKFAPRISFFFVAQSNLFEEIAKFRAARRIWAKIIKKRFKAQDDRSARLRFHTQTAGVTLTAQQPENNIIRTTIQALAAVLGGTQSLHVNSKDEALALPTEESAQLSLRTQQILAYETGIVATTDPVGGSYYIEELTAQIEKEVNEYIKKIDGLGGAVLALEEGFQAKEIQNSAFEYQKSVENESSIIVGVNKYKSDTPPIEKIQTIDQKQTARQIQKIKKLRENRDRENVNECLARLKTISKTRDNIMPAILDCAKAYCTLGEISDALRSVFGEYGRRD